MVMLDFIYKNFTDLLGKVNKRKFQNEKYVYTGYRRSDPWLSRWTPNQFGFRDSWFPVLNSYSIVQWQVMRGASPNTWQYNV